MGYSEPLLVMVGVAVCLFGVGVSYYRCCRRMFAVVGGGVGTEGGLHH